MSEPPVMPPTTPFMPPVATPVSVREVHSIDFFWGGGERTSKLSIKNLLLILDLPMQLFR